MGVTVTIRDQAAAGGTSGTYTLADFTPGTTLRDVIRTRVREEVAEHNARPSRCFSGLVMPDGARTTPDGFVLPNPRRIDWERQADAAIEAFLHNGFVVLVGDRQVTDLDEQLHLSADTEVRFIRLVPLAGG